jgi:hypothetical protein
MGAKVFRERQGGEENVCGCDAHHKPPPLRLEAVVAFVLRLVSSALIGLHIRSIALTVHSTRLSNEHSLRATQSILVIELESVQIVDESSYQTWRIRGRHSQHPTLTPTIRSRTRLMDIHILPLTRIHSPVRPR